MNRVVQIVPRINPDRDGVGDYALCLARELRARHGVTSTFVSGNPGWRGADEIDGFPIDYLADKDRSGALAAVVARYSPAPVFLNYVPPGYDRNSCPLWLWRGLRQWKTDTQGRLISRFHEFYSEGPPWTRSFWTNPVQKYIGRRIATLSDGVSTTVDIVRHRLNRLEPGLQERITTLPVFSNVGETDATPAGSREPWLAVFGSADWRRMAYEDFGSDLARACALFGITEIVDIGEPLGVAPTAPVPVRLLGRLAADATGALLARCRFGFVAYPEEWIAKSGIFAAYCGHGCIPLIARARCSGSTSVPVVPVADGADRLDLTHQQQRVRAWYQPHSVSNQAALLRAQAFKLAT